jgi:hypothetical protein
MMLFSSASMLFISLKEGIPMVTVCIGMILYYTSIAF